MSSISMGVHVGPSSKACSACREKVGINSALLMLLPDEHCNTHSAVLCRNCVKWLYKLTHLCARKGCENHARYENGTCALHASKEDKRV